MFLLLYRGKHGLKHVYFDKFPNGIDLHPFESSERELIDHLFFDLSRKCAKIIFLTRLVANNYGDEKPNHEGNKN